MRNQKEMKYYLCKINQKQKKINVKISGVVRNVRQKAEEDKQEHKGRALRQCIWDGTTIGDKLGIWSYASHSRKVEK